MAELTMLDWALRYSSLGWHVFPCHTPIKKPGWSCSCEAWQRKSNSNYSCEDAGKHPRTKHGLLDATTDEAQIRAWWKRWDFANIGISCGPSGLLVVDLDKYKDIYQGHDLELDEETVTALTGGGGTHLLYRLEAEDNFSNKDKMLPPGINIRGRGGYIVVAPSKHKSGGQYQWEVEWGPWDADLKPIPPKLREVLAAGAYRPQTRTYDTTKKYVDKITPYGEKALKEVCREIEEAQRGNWHNTIISVCATAGRLVGGGEIDPDYAFETLAKTALETGRILDPDGYDQAKTEKDITDALDFGTQNPRSSKAEDDIDDVINIDVCPNPTLLFGGQLPVQRDDTYPYAVREGVLQVYVKNKDDDGFKPIADFNAWISQEVITETGKRYYTVDGKGLRGRPFSVRVDAELFGNASQLVAVMEAAAGAYNKVYAGKGNHLGPAIKTLSDNVSTVQKFDRTGWADDQFLFPGHNRDGEEIELLRQLRYGLQPGANMDTGLEALSALMRAIPAEQSTVIISFLLSAPLYRKLNIGDRYGLFINGKSGSLKTSYCQVAMSLYGEFTNDDILIKWGSAGSTVNALAEICARASDMPILIDNYKPNTGAPQEFVKFVHMTMEGGTKAALNRARAIRESVSINTWPLFTGEDVPQDDGATLARMLVQSFGKQTGMNHALTEAQSKARHLSAIGSEWIRYIEDGQIVADIARFDELRACWVQKLQESQENVLNPLRIANNLALNQMVWEAALTHPELGPVLAPHTQAHQRGLHGLVGTMADQTSESVEAKQWIDKVGALLTSGAATLIVDGDNNADLKRHRMIGWQTANEICLLPALVDVRLKEAFGPYILNGISSNALYRQLREMDVFYRTDADGKKTTVPVKFEGKLHRVICLKRDAFDSKDRDPEEQALEELLEGL